MQGFSSEHAFFGLRRRYYRVAMIDPPWKFSGGTEGRPQHYKRMTDAEIAALPIAELAHPDGMFVFLWITSPIDGPRFWGKIAPVWEKQGLRYSGRGFVWIKLAPEASDSVYIHRSFLSFGQGYTTRKNAEDALIFKVGAPKRRAADVPEIIIAARGRHSEKPDEAYARVEKFCAGPYADVFSRKRRANWDCSGDEVGKFNGEAA